MAAVADYAFAGLKLVCEIRMKTRMRMMRMTRMMKTMKRMRMRNMLE